MQAETTVPVDKSEQRVRRMFGEIAPSYDRMNHLLSMQVDRYWRWWTARKLRPQGELPILDVCTGTGDLALAFYRHTQGKTEIVASDFCPEMLQIGERKKQRAGIPDDRLTFVEADAQSLPFDSNRFQIVSVAFGLRNMTHKDRALAEMRRVLKPGGKLLVLEFSRVAPALAPAYDWYSFNVLPKMGQLVAGDEASYRYLAESIRMHPDQETLAGMMREAGLDRVQFFNMTAGVVALHEGVRLG